MTDQNEGLKRELGIADVAINVINIAIASGIFLVLHFGQSFFLTLCAYISILFNHNSMPAYFTLCQLP